MKIFLFVSILIFSNFVFAASFEGNISEWKTDSRSQFSEPERNFKLALEKIKAGYAGKKLSDEDIYRAALEGVLAALNDKDEDNERQNANILLSPRMMDDFYILQTGKVTGIGATLQFIKETSQVIIREPLPSSAAEKAGLKRGDVILAVNGQKTKGKKLPEVAYEVRGPAGEPVKLKILRDDEILNLKVVRENIKLKEVEGEKVNSSVAFISIDGFSSRTVGEVAEKLKSLDNPNLTKLIIDLRSNNGGEYEAGLKTTEMFLPKDAVIVRTKYSDGQVKEERAQNQAWRPDVKLVVLTNGETSCAAEFFAAALRDYRHALLVGGTTHGKWNGQTVDELPNKFSIKFSVMTFETGKGQSYQGEGIKPDVEVKDDKIVTHTSDLKMKIAEDAAFRAALQI